MKEEEKQERYSLSEKGSWMCCLWSQSDPEVWLVVFFRGQWSAPPSSLTKPPHLSLSQVLYLETLVGSRNLALILPWELGVSHHVSFPVFCLCEKWAMGGCSVMDRNHLFETHFPVLRKHWLWGSQTTCRGLCSHGAPQAAAWEKRFPGSPVALSVCSTCAVLCGWTQLQFSVTPEPSLAGGDKVISLLSSLLDAPFPLALGLRSASPLPWHPQLWVLGVTLSAFLCWRPEQS